ncbi:MAG: FAD-dependent oxidoreductase [Gammaproteobacteria bacterium]
MPADRLTLVGAGLAGPLAALLLAQKGWQVTVIERRADPRTGTGVGGRSINLALAARGLRALAAGGIEAQVKPLLIPMRGRMTHDREGKTELLPYGQRPEEVIHSVSREGLNRLLVEAAAATGRIEFLFERTLEDFDPERGALTLAGAGDRSETLEAKITIGADGAGSALRRALIERGIVRAREDMLDHAYKELSIPPGKNSAHSIEREALHVWPRGGYMLIALPNTDGSFTVTLFLSRDLAREGEPGFASLTTPAAVEKFFAREFPDALVLMPNLAKEFFANPTGALGTVYSEPWHAEGKALLLGDAAHAIVPFHGQGMNAGFEDAAELAGLLDENPQDPATVFAEFETRRKPNADAIAAMSLANYIEMRDGVADPHYLLKRELAAALTDRLPGHFMSRYRMVSFTSIPYATCVARDREQTALMKSILNGHDDLDGIDLAAAATRVRQALPPLPEGA